MVNPVLMDDNYHAANSNEVEEQEDLSPKSPGSVVEGVEREKVRKEEENLTGEKEVKNVRKEMEPTVTADK